MCNKETLCDMISDSTLEPFEKVELTRIANESPSLLSTAIVLLSVKIATLVKDASDNTATFKSAIAAINLRCEDQCGPSSGWQRMIIKCKREICFCVTVIAITLILRPELRDVITIVKDGMS